MLRRIDLLAGLAASVVIDSAIVLWSQQPSYKPFYGSPNEVDTSRAMEALTTTDIPYKVEPDSDALLVKADDLDRACMKMASAGVTPTDNNVGFEIFDKEQALGTSQFMEATNYHYGLEGELAHTVSSLDNVKAARAYLAISKNPVFIHDNHKPSASVLVGLYSDRSLEPSQVMAIANSVATSVPKLDKPQVIVIGQRGNLLSDQQELSGLTVADKQFDFTWCMEGPFAQRVHNILRPVLGNGHYEAEVSADVDFNAAESTSEMYNPDQPTLRSEQRNNERRQNSSGPQGVPGALSNQPPDPANTPQQTTASAPADYAALGQPLKDINGQIIIGPKTGKPELAPCLTDKCDQATRNYELNRPISRTKQQQERLRRLSMAVVLDDWMKVDAETGEVSHQPWSADELACFTRLVQDPVGYDASRGDSASVIDAPFAPVQVEKIDSIPLYSQPWLWDTVRQMLGVLFILVLVFGVLCPMLGNTTGDGRGESLAGGGGRDGDLVPDESGLEGSLADDRVGIDGLLSILLSNPMEGYDAQLNAIKNLVTQDPGRVAQVVKEWVNADE